MDEKNVEDFMKMDLYGLLGIVCTATTKEIKAAYRKKALSCHPDKNPDNVKAAEEFQQLTKILEFLTDEKLKNTYDQKIKAKQEAQKRYEQLSTIKKKFKDELEAKEKRHYESQLKEKYYKEEIERLQKEGEQMLEEEQRKMSEQNAKKQNLAYTVKLKWKAEKNDPTNGGYNYDLLYRLLYKYGDINVLVVSSTKNGRGIVEFKTKDAAEMAVNYEVGFSPTNPLKLISLWNPKVKSSNNDKQDYTKLRNVIDPKREEERRRLIEAMRREDEEC